MTEVELTVHRVTVRRDTNGAIAVRVHQNKETTARVMEITPEESADLAYALETLNAITGI